MIGADERCGIGRKIGAGSCELAQFFSPRLLPTTFKLGQRSIKAPLQQVIKPGFNIHAHASK